MLQSLLYLNDNFLNLFQAFLSKFVDETATQNRRRSQTEDENPLSPVPTLDALDSGFLGSSGQLKPGSPAQCRSQESVSSTSGPGSGLRFHLPMTPPSGSNPHTPASPHTSVLSQVKNFFYDMYCLTKKYLEFRLSLLKFSDIEMFNFP